MQATWFPLNMNRILRSTFVQNAARLFSGSVLSQAITLAALPLITRTYSPEDYGVFAVFLSISTITAALAGLSLPSGIVRSTSAQKANQLFSFTLHWILSVHAIFLVVALLFLEQLGLQLMEIVLGVVGSSVMSLFASFQAFSNYRTRYTSLSVQAVIRAIVYVVLALFIPVFSGSATGEVLFLAHILSCILSIIYLSWALQLGGVVFASGLQHTVSIFRHEKDIVTFLFPASWIDLFSERSVILKFQSALMDAAIGNYHLAQRTLSMPATLISSSVAKVFTPELAKRIQNNEGNIKEFVVKVWLGLALVGLLPLILVAAFAPPLFTLVFGTEWEVAGQMAQVMSVGYYAKFISIPTSSIFLVSRRLAWSFYLTIFTGIARAAGTLIGFFLDGAYGAVVGYTIADIIAIILYNRIGYFGLEQP